MTTGRDTGEEEGAVGPWHLLDDDLRCYVDGRIDAARRWSVEEHLMSCGDCRVRLSDRPDVVHLVGGWDRLDDELDAPVPGVLERAIRRMGVSESTARLLMATPLLRASWLGSVFLTLLLAAVAALVTRSLRTPLSYLAVAPLLPLIGVATSFGPRADPAYEVTVVAPISNLRLLLLRSTTVLVTTGLLSGVVSLALPAFGLVTLGWVIPALTLTIACLALMAVVGPALAASSVGAGWIAVLAWTAQPHTGQSVLFTADGQLVLTSAAVVAAMVVAGTRSRFDPARAVWTTAPPPEGTDDDQS